MKLLNITLSISVFSTSLLLTSLSLHSGDDFFQIDFKTIPTAHDQVIMELTFPGKIPPPDEVDKLLRSALESAIKIDNSRDITALVFQGDEVLRKPNYSGSLFYKANAKQILNEDALNQTKSLQYETEKYSVLVKDGKTLKGVSPARTWLTAEVIFPTEPSEEQAYEAALNELKKVATQGLDVSIYVFVGDKEKETERTQMKDLKRGGYIFMRYDHATKKVFKKNDYLTTLP